jgi:hypothetical protein
VTIIHAKLALALAQPEFVAACRGIRDVVGGHLTQGQTAEVYFVNEGEVTDVCEIEGT